MSHLDRLYLSFFSNYPNLRLTAPLKPADHKAVTCHRTPGQQHNVLYSKLVSCAGLATTFCTFLPSNVSVDYKNQKQARPESLLVPLSTIYTVQLLHVVSSHVHNIH